jgi:catechol 2,3-dioxygenase-like lactoylglutathione lyase family enzyme
MDKFLAETFAGNLFAVTILAKDLATSRDFYGQKLGLTNIFNDEVSSIYKAGGTMINVLSDVQAGELIAPAHASNGGSRTVFTLKCQEVDSAAVALQEAGIEILNGPIDRPWGVRTVSFQDPDGIIWELANH